MLSRCCAQTDASAQESMLAEKSGGRRVEERTRQHTQVDKRRGWAGYARPQIVGWCDQSKETRARRMCTCIDAPTGIACSLRPAALRFPPSPLRRPPQINVET